MEKEIKKNYQLEKRKIKEKYKQQLKEYYLSCEKENIINPPKRSVLEEIGNAITHGVGAIFAIVAFILMMINASTKIQTIAAIIYFLGLFIMFTVSCLYHSFRYGSKVKRLFRRFDYSSIYLLIGATFVPILLIFVGEEFGTIFFIIQWLIIILGVTLVAVFGPTKLRPLHITLYFLLGWSGLLFIPKMINENIILFYYILFGGVIYSLGIIPFALKKKVSHFIWHFFVLLGAVTQWVGIFICLY